MPNYTISTTDGDKQVEGKKFAFYLKNIRYWFFVHATDGQFAQTVSELKTGMKVRDIGFNALVTCGNNVDAAKLTLKQLIEQVGEDRVKVVIDSAPKLAKYKAKGD